MFWGPETLLKANSLSSILIVVTSFTVFEKFLLAVGGICSRVIRIIKIK